MMMQKKFTFITILIFLLLFTTNIYSSAIDNDLNNSSNPSFEIADLAKPAFRIYNQQDGLPQNSAKAIAFDKKGYLWVGTEDGVTYYNGHNWTVLNMPNRTLSNSVNAILVASDNSLWFGTGGGLVKYQADKWTVFDTKNSGLPSNNIYSLQESKTTNGDAIIWVGTYGGGLAKYQDNQWTVFNTKNSALPDNNVKSLLESRSLDGNSVLWIGTKGGGLAKYQDNKWTVFNTDNSTLPNNNIYSLQETRSKDGNSILWIGTYGGGLARFEESKRSTADSWTIFDTKNSALPDNNIRSLLQTKSKTGHTIIWVGTNSGLAKFDDGKWTIFDAKNSALPGTSISSLEESSSEGNSILWIGTDGGGLARLEEGKWLVFDTKNSALPNNLVNSLLETKSPDGHAIYWIGTNGGGLAKLEDGKWTIFDTRNSALPGNIVYTLLETKSRDGHAIIWAGTDGDGLAKFEDGKWTVFDTKNSGLPNNTVRSVIESRSPDGHSILWIGTYGGGLAKFDEGKWTVFDTKNSGLPSNIVYTLLESKSADGQAIIWAGTQGGLAKFDEDKWTVFNITNSDLPNNSVFSVLESRSPDGQATIWVGTNGGGLAYFDPALITAKWNTLSDTTNPALPNNTINQIREDAQHNIYLFTNKGIARLTPRKPTVDNAAQFTIHTFTKEDGLSSNECNAGASMIDSRGRIWGGTIEGAVIFDPSQETEDHVTKQLYIERIFVDGKVRALENASLAYNENNITFEFALLSYFKESDTKYRTQLVGLDGEPSDWVNENKKFYTTLPEGNYIFKVWGRDYAGNESGPISIAFQIRPAFWRTWWAYVLYFLILASAGYSAYRYQLQVLEQRNYMLEAKVAERTNELAAALDQVKLSHKETEKKNEKLEEALDEVKQKNQQLVESHQRADRIFSALAEALPGTILDEKYKLDEKIGSGGFGAVYRATHLAMKRAIAVKIFKPTPGNDSAEALQRFQLEAISTSRVNHPNAVAVLDSGISSEGIAYLVMELLNGHSLKTELREKGSLSLERSAQIIIPVCDVIAKAHAGGILHRDIKPDNIFLNITPEGEVVKVVDFGIAKLLDDNLSLDIQHLTATGGIIGTPTYMAPERFGLNYYDGKSDVYSIGVMLYEMLCGKDPFAVNGNTLLGLLTQKLGAEIPPLRQFNPNISEEVEAIVMQAVLKDPEERPTAKEFAENFAKAANVVIDTTLNSIKIEIVEDAKLKTDTLKFNHNEQQLLAESHKTDEISDNEKGSEHITLTLPTKKEK